MDMVYVYSGSNSTVPIGKVMDYNNTNPSSKVAVYRILSQSYNPQQSMTTLENNFSNAFYHNSGYSLEHPTVTGHKLAQNIDLLA